LLSIYIVNHEKFLKLIPVRYNFIHRILRFYTKIRISFIILEFIFLLSCLFIMISVSYGLVSVYIKYRFNSNIRMKGNNDSSLELNVDNNSETLSQITAVKSSFLPENLDSENILNSVITILKPILEPISVDYSNEMLANQISGLSIILFILSIMILILLSAFIVNIIILVYSDKLMNFFTNKYIRWYIAVTKN